MVSLAETPLTGKPDAGNPPVRFGGRGSGNAALPTPINRQSRDARCLRWPSRFGEGLTPVSDVEFIGSAQHGLDGGAEFGGPEGFPQDQAADLLDECLVSGFRAITG